MNHKHYLAIRGEARAVWFPCSLRSFAFCETSFTDLGRPSLKHVSEKLISAPSQKKDNAASAELRCFVDHKLTSAFHVEFYPVGRTYECLYFAMRHKGGKADKVSK